MADILDDLLDLHKQATTERSHYYVASCCKKAIDEISRLRAALAECSAPWASGEGTVMSCAAQVSREFQRRMDVAASALHADR